MSYLRQYCRIERRHMARAVLHGLLAAALVVVLVTFLLYGVSTAVQKRADREKITAAMVFPDNDQGKTLRELSEIIQNQKSINNFCNFVYLLEEQALSDLQNGTVQAVIVFGETFLSDVMTGVNSPAVVYLPEDAALDTQEFRELVQDGVSLIGTGEAGIYSGEQLADVLTLRVELSALDDVLTERFAMEALSRGSRFASEYVSAFGEEEPEQYYAASLLSVLLLMMGLLFSGLYGEQDRTVRKCLRRLDIGAVKTGSVRVLFMSLALWITAAAAVLVFSLFTGIIGRGTGALPDLLLYRIFLLYPLCFSLSGFFHFVYGLARGDGSGAMLMLLLDVGMIFLAGCILPAAFLPGPAASAGKVLPMRVWRESAGEILYGTLDGRNLFLLILIGAVSGAGGMLCEAWKLRK